MTTLILKRAKASRSSGEWNDGYDVLADGVVIEFLALITSLKGNGRCSNEPKKS
jgi:hypothetical protein